MTFLVHFLQRSEVQGRDVEFEDDIVSPMSPSRSAGTVSSGDLGDISSIDHSSSSKPSSTFTSPRDGSSLLLNQTLTLNKSKSSDSSSGSSMSRWVATPGKEQPSIVTPQPTPGQTPSIGGTVVRRRGSAVSRTLGTVQQVPTTTASPTTEANKTTSPPAAAASVNEQSQSLFSMETTDNAPQDVTETTPFTVPVTEPTDTFLKPPAPSRKRSSGTMSSSKHSETLFSDTSMGKSSRSSESFKRSSSASLFSNYSEKVSPGRSTLSDPGPSLEHTVVGSDPQSNMSALAALAPKEKTSPRSQRDKAQKSSAGADTSGKSDTDKIR